MHLYKQHSNLIIFQNPDEKTTSSKDKKRANEQKDAPKNKKKAKIDSKNGDKTQDENQDEKNGDSSDDDKDKDFEVDRIIDVQNKKNGKKEFLIRWKGYSSKHDTWEPQDNLNCPELISKFLAKAEHCQGNSKELRENPSHTKRFTLAGGNRRSSKRNDGRQRSLLFFKFPIKSKSKKQN